MKIIAPIKVEGLSITIDIIDIATGETVDSGSMYELSYGHYAYEFEGYETGHDYFIRATDGGIYIYETTTGYENVLSDNIALKLNEDYKSGKWTMGNGMAYKGGGGGDTVIGGISIEQLNTSVAQIIGSIDKSTTDIKKDIKDTRVDIEGLLEIQADIETAMKLQKKDFIKVDVDYSKIIESINGIKASMNNDSIKGDIRELLIKMDAYKQLDISDITEAIIAKLETKTDTKDILATIKNNFKDLNNKIKDLKEFNEKLDMKDRTKVIEDTYKLLENIDNTGMSDILERLGNISSRVNLMSQDLETYFEE